MCFTIRHLSSAACGRLARAALLNLGKVKKSRSNKFYKKTWTDIMNTKMGTLCVPSNGQCAACPSQKNCPIWGAALLNSPIEDGEYLMYMESAPLAKWMLQAGEVCLVWDTGDISSQTLSEIFLWMMDDAKCIILDKIAILVDGDFTILAKGNFCK